MRRSRGRGQQRPSRACGLEALEDRRMMTVDAPIVANLPPAEVGAAHALVGGQVVRAGVDTPAVTLYWGDEDGGQDAGAWDHAVPLGTHSGDFQYELEGLAAQTAYFYRAFATNSFGPDWANVTSSLFTAAPSGMGTAMYNDHAATALTHVNATDYAGDGVASGLLKDFATGQPTSITLTTTGVGVSYFNGSGVPTEGTDADDIFGGIIGFAPGIVAVTGSDSYTHAYSGLDPQATYEFAGTAVRGDDDYTNRWTLVTLDGAEAFTPAHSVGEGVITAGLPENQMVFWAGGNHDPGQGWVAQWTDIDPGADGQFEVVSSQYTGAVPPSIDPGGVADGTRSYALAATRLIEGFEALIAVQSDPAPGEVFATAPTTATLDFNGSVDPATLDAGDLTINGSPAASVELLDADSVRWTLPAGLTSGQYEMNVADGAMTSTDGETFLGYAAPFSIAALPAVENAAATDVLATSAAIGVDVTDAGFDPPQVLLYWGENDGGTNAAAWDNVVDLGAIDSGVVEFDLTSLAQDATYSYRALASNAAGDVWATSTASFATLAAELPAVVNRPAAGVSAFSATLAGEVVDLGNDVPAATIYYGTVDGGVDAGAWQHSVDLGLQTGAFQATVAGLAAETEYFFRTSANNGAGTSWAGNSGSFTTTNLPALVINEIAGGDSDYLTTRVRPSSTDPFPTVALTPDWIEIYNPTAAPAGLAGFHLTDNANNPLKWAFPAGTVVPAGGYLVVFASGENIVDPQLDETGRLHTNFELNNNGEYLALTSAEGQVVHEYAPDFPRLREGFTYGRDASGDATFFSAATPGALNNDGSIVAGFVKDTQFTLDRGFYDVPIAVGITTATPGATIVYTTDGSVPTLANGMQTPAPNATTPPTAAVNISTTTVLRARAYFADWIATNVDTQTYIYLGDVINQPTAPSGFPSSWGGAPAVDYAMDPEVVSDPAYAQDLIDGLREIPSLSITTPVADLFGPAGIYSNTTDGNLEVVAAAELIYGDGTSGFQVDAGLKVQGGASRNPNNSPKHALSLRFRDSIADGKLEFPLFEDSPVTTFDSLQLRARYNNSWIHWSPEQRGRGTLLKDVWMRDTLLDMGQADAGQSQPVHLYLNGLYWGVYMVEERPEASHFAAYHGGDESQYDALNGDSPVDGNLDSFNAMRATVQTRNWAAIQQVLDVDNFIDFTLAEQFGRNNDIKPVQNWKSAGGGSAGAPWRFYSWDSERVLEGVGENATGTTDPTDMLGTLLSIEEFRIRFADRVQMHFFQDGALTPPKTSERLQERIDELNNAIVAESARWGDYRRDVHQRNCGCDLYTRDVHWQAENDRITDDYLPIRTNIVLNEYRAAGLFPTFDAPLFEIDGAAQHGGAIDAEAMLTFDSATDVYYTLDGTDPRAEGGAVVGTLYRPGVSDPIVLNSSTQINARTRSGATWSALNTTLFAVAPPPGSLAITELHYHPANHPDLPDEDDQEFIELKNVSDQSVDLSGLQITQFASTPYVFPGGVTLGAGQYIVVARNPAALESIYSSAINLAPEGYAERNLSNGGETIALVDALGNELLRFTYDDEAPWPTAPDGDGPSLEMINPLGDPTDPANWQASTRIGGSPGSDGSSSPVDRDDDGDVDGADFLALQRGFGTTSTSDDFLTWEQAFGQSPAAAATNLASETSQVSSVSAAAHSRPPQTTGAPSPADLRDAAIALWQFERPHPNNRVPIAPPQQSSSASPHTEPPHFAAARRPRTAYSASLRAAIDDRSTRDDQNAFPADDSELVDEFFANALGWQ